MTTFHLATTAPDFPAEDLFAIGVLLMAVLITFLVMFAISIVICALLFVAQKRVPAEHRKIEPLLVWLLLIPLFNLVWNFFVFRRIPQSYRSYFHAQGRTDVGDCGEMIGLWYSICIVVAVLPIPCVNWIAGIGGLALLIIFLVKIFGLRGQIPETAAPA